MPHTTDTPDPQDIQRRLNAQLQAHIATTSVTSDCDDYRYRVDVTVPGEYANINVSVYEYDGDFGRVSAVHRYAGIPISVGWRNLDYPANPSDAIIHHLTAEYESDEILTVADEKVGLAPIDWFLSVEKRLHNHASTVLTAFEKKESLTIGPSLSFDDTDVYLSYSAGQQYPMPTFSADAFIAFETDILTDALSHTSLLGVFSLNGSPSFDAAKKVSDISHDLGQHQRSTSLLEITDATELSFSTRSQPTESSDRTSPVPDSIVDAAAYAVDAYIADMRGHVGNRVCFFSEMPTEQDLNAARVAHTTDPSDTRFVTDSERVLGVSSLIDFEQEISDEIGLYAPTQPDTLTPGTPAIFRTLVDGEPADTLGYSILTDVSADRVLVDTTRPKTRITSIDRISSKWELILETGVESANPDFTGDVEIMDVWDDRSDASRLEDPSYMAKLRVSGEWNNWEIHTDESTYRYQIETSPVTIPFANLLS